MALTREALRVAMLEHLPIGSSEAGVVLAIHNESALDVQWSDHWIREEAGTLQISLAIVTYEKDRPAGSDPMIWDVRAESIDFAPLVAQSPERAEAFLRGWATVVREVLATPTFWSASSEMNARDLMPFDVFALERASSAPDFEKALRQKSRLGSLLEPAPSG